MSPNTKNDTGGQVVAGSNPVSPTDVSPTDVSPTEKPWLYLWVFISRGCIMGPLGTNLGPVQQPVQQPSTIATAPLDEPDG
jgi:hypothetical protein